MIILRRNKKIVELFPIGSSKDALNSRRKPLFYGYLRLTRTNNQIRPYKFIVKKGDKESLFPPSEAMKILKKQNVYLIDGDEEIEEMLDSLNIDFKKTRICRHCTLEGYITVINRKSSYLSHKEYICRLCAEEEIKRELKYKGLSLSAFNNFKRMLDKTGDLDKVLSVFDPKFNPVQNPDLTLFDKIVVGKDNTPKVKIDDLKIPEELKKILKTHGKYLLPVQSLALQNGLLKGENLIVVSATASGKTLIGEIAGVPNAMNGKKFMFLTPLVALANQKYRDFNKKYGKLGLKIALKVGMSRIKAKEELTLPDDDIKNADIVVGTYEGLDFLLRSGKAGDFGELGTVVIDEIHMLDDKERGPRLNGLIKRLKSLFKNIQIIGLSATIQNPQEIANEFSMKLVEYDRRPVPLERHLIFAKSEYEKTDLMTKLARTEYKHTSKKGFHGQTIIFTNSRRKTHSIADYLVKRNIKAAAYHAGLSYSKKSKIEKEFANQKISTVVTTAALAAGVDFPASQVIFESLIMGNKWLSNNEFSQMLGRAGRPSYHDIGKVYLIPEVGRKYGEETEDMQAVSLLESDVDPIHVEYDEDDVLEQCLADICSGRVHTFEELQDAYKNLDIPLSLEEAYDVIHDRGMVKEQNNKISSTSYGKAVSVSFLDLNAAEYIKKSINLKNYDKKKKHRIDPLEIAVKLDPFENAYMSNRLNRRLGKALNANISSRLFADSTLDILSSGETVSKLEPGLQDALINLQVEFMSCRCQDRPFCNCFQEELSRRILKQRILKKDPVDISKKLLKTYQIHSYAGDIFSWLDSVIRTLEAVRRVANAFKNQKVAKECSRLIRTIEN
jgi:Superfamily II helicase, archaea-specific